MNLWNTKRTAKTKWQRAGFTLLELLVVISIIGILTAIGMVAFSQAQKKGRDARRVGDLKQIQNAFEQYNSKNNGSYNDSCPTMATGGGLPSFPTDPKTNLPYPATCNATAGTYCVCADIEDDTKNNSDASCDFTAGTKTRYCVKNLQ